MPTLSALQFAKPFAQQVKNTAKLNGQQSKPNQQQGGLDSQQNNQGNLLLQVQQTKKPQALQAQDDQENPMNAMVQAMKVMAALFQPQVQGADKANSGQDSVNASVGGVSGLNPQLATAMNGPGGACAANQNMNQAQDVNKVGAAQGLQDIQSQGKRLNVVA